jgi:N-acetyltransferase
MMGFSDSVTLIGQQASLAPLSQAHRDQLAEAVKDGELRTLWYTSIPSPDRMAAEIGRHIEAASNRHKRDAAR